MDSVEIIPDNGENKKSVVTVKIVGPKYENIFSGVSADMLVQVMRNTDSPALRSAIKEYLSKREVE